MFFVRSKNSAPEWTGRVAAVCRGWKCSGSVQLKTRRVESLNSGQGYGRECKQRMAHPAARAHATLRDSGVIVVRGCLERLVIC